MLPEKAKKEKYASNSVAIFFFVDTFHVGFLVFCSGAMLIGKYCEWYTHDPNSWKIDIKNFHPYIAPSILYFVFLLFVSTGLLLDFIGKYHFSVLKMTMAKIFSVIHVLLISFGWLGIEVTMIVEMINSIDKRQKTTFGLPRIVFYSVFICIIGVCGCILFGFGVWGCVKVFEKGEQKPQKCRVDLLFDIRKYGLLLQSSGCVAVSFFVFVKTVFYAVAAWYVTMIPAPFWIANAVWGVLLGGFLILWGSSVICLWKARSSHLPRSSFFIMGIISIIGTFLLSFVGWLASLGVNTPWYGDILAPVIETLLIMCLLPCWGTLACLVMSLKEQKRRTRQMRQICSAQTKTPEDVEKEVVTFSDSSTIMENNEEKIGDENQLV